MSSQTGSIHEENVDYLPPSTLLCTNNGSPPTNETNSSKVKRNDYLKQRGRRKKWWYFSRSLQPISEAGENKDDPPITECCTVVTDDSIGYRDEYLNIKNNSLNEIPSDSIIINNSNIQQAKESYSPCLKVIEKFQEIVMDSAVRVIQAAFKRFRERRRFLRIKKAVMVIQRNLRKWIQARHPCLRPAEFNRQFSDSAKSDEYRETEEKTGNDKNLADDEDSYAVESEDNAEGNIMETHEMNSDETQETTSNSDLCQSDSIEYGSINLQGDANEGVEVSKDNTNTMCTECSIDHQHDCDEALLDKECTGYETTYETEECLEEMSYIMTSKCREQCHGEEVNYSELATDGELESVIQDMTFADANNEFPSQGGLSTENVTNEMQISNKCCQEEENQQYNKELQRNSSQSDDGIPDTSNIEPLSESVSDNFNDNNNRTNINKVKISQEEWTDNE